MPALGCFSGILSTHFVTSGRNTGEIAGLPPKGKDRKNENELHLRRNKEQECY